MTRQEVIDAWAGGTAEERFDSIVAYVNERIAGVTDLIDPFNLVEDATVANVFHVGGSEFKINPDFFTDPDPNPALGAADTIVWLLFQLAMQSQLQSMKKQKEYEKDAKKARAKYWDKLTKDSKPKGKDAMGVYYEIYVKPILELEKGSG